MLIGEAIEDGIIPSTIEEKYLKLDLCKAEWSLGGIKAYQRHLLGLGCAPDTIVSRNNIQKLRCDHLRVDIVNEIEGREPIFRTDDRHPYPVVIFADFGTQADLNYLPTQYSSFWAWNAQINAFNKRDLKQYWANMPHHIIERINLLSVNEHEWDQIKDHPPYIETIAVTRPNGVTVMDGKTRTVRFKITHQENQRSVVDTVGCGDAFLSAMAVAMGTGVSTLNAAKLGCLAGALATTWRLNKEAICPKKILQLNKTLNIF